MKIGKDNNVRTQSNSDDVANKISKRLLAIGVELGSELFDSDNLIGKEDDDSVDVIINDIFHGNNHNDANVINVDDNDIIVEQIDNHSDEMDALNEVDTVVISNDNVDNMEVFVDQASDNYDSSHHVQHDVDIISEIDLHVDNQADEILEEDAGWDDIDNEESDVNDTGIDIDSAVDMNDYV